MVSLIVSLTYLALFFLAILPSTKAYALLGCYSTGGSLTLSATYYLQSGQYCYSVCKDGGYAYMALNNGNQCWCGASSPSSSNKIDSSSCSMPCVGYPQEMCGGKSSWSVYLVGDSGYTENLSIPSGGTSSTSSSTSSRIFSTQSSSSTSDDSTSSSSYISSSSSDSQSPTSSPSPSPLSSSLTSSSSSSSSSSSIPSTKSSISSPVSSAEALSAGPIIRTTAVTTLFGGTSQVVVTQTVTETPTLNPTLSSPSSSESGSTVVSGKEGGSRVKGGAIAGIVIGVIAGLALLGLVVFLFRRHKKQNSQDSYANPLSSRDFIDFGMPVNTSTDNFGSGPRPPGGGGGNVVNGVGVGAGLANLKSLDDDKESGLDYSNGETFLAIDQRLNPIMLGERRLSGNSLADDRDYSRKILRVANPDNL
ncbi:WSC-domain-containing protein [Nadsonia fulvescens var. elongata DSM 6958]|uniref:WSC-domain-containing protein n=1 Tax=Nadsonia fulvescens var. elongata DSM 6958 TaxID=857566 RepID=A0A1E3PP61_9ASCO|nr:WSC-domain-containing protein [Nadsonia fulvescens var. elongata DSM 6958]